MIFYITGLAVEYVKLREIVVVGTFVKIKDPSSVKDWKSLPILKVKGKHE
jgi:hypothetical protein